MFRDDGLSIYKVCPAAEWSGAVAAGAFRGSPVDLRDGFIHFSTGAQLAETVRRHFAGQADLVIVAVDPLRLGDRLRWEPSRGGALFPHLYGELPVAVGRIVARVDVDAAGDARPQSSMTDKVRFEGLTLTVESVERSIAYYGAKLGLDIQVDAAPAFAMVRVPGAGGGTIGLLSLAEARKEGVEPMTAAQKRGIHVELSTDDLDGLYEELKAKGVEFHEPPHDEPWERSMTALDPDGYAVEFAQGRRGHNSTRT